MLHCCLQAKTLLQHFKESTAQALQQAQQQWRSTADNIAGHFSATRLATAAILLVIFLGCFGLAALPASPSSTNRGSASGWYSGNATAGYCAANDTSSQLEAAVLQHSTAQGGMPCTRCAWLVQPPAQTPAAQSQRQVCLCLCGGTCTGCAVPLTTVQPMGRGSRRSCPLAAPTPVGMYSHYSRRLVMMIGRRPTAWMRWPPWQGLSTRMAEVNLQLHCVARDVQSKHQQ